MPWLVAKQFDNMYLGRLGHLTLKLEFLVSLVPSPSMWPCLLNKYKVVLNQDG